MKHVLTLAALVLAFSVSAGRALADDKADVLTGAKAWGAAFSDGDAAALKAHSIGTDEEVARWDGLSKMVGAMKKLGDAAKARYGAEGAKLSQMIKKPDFVTVDAEGKVEVTGDEATLAVKNGKAMKLKKDGAEWKVLLSSLAAAGKMDPKQVATMTTAFSTTADEVTAGQHPTYVAALQALGQKIQAANAARKAPVN